MINADIKDRWDETSIPRLVKDAEDNDITLSWTEEGAKKKRVIQEVMHDDINSEEIA